MRSSAQRCGEKRTTAFTPGKGRRGAAPPLSESWATSCRISNHFKTTSILDKASLLDDESLMSFTCPEASYFSLHLKKAAHSTSYIGGSSALPPARCGFGSPPDQLPGSTRRCSSSDREVPSLPQGTVQAFRWYLCRVRKRPSRRSKIHSGKPLLQVGLF